MRDILKNESSERYAKFLKGLKEAEGILGDIKVVFPKYTNHDIPHAKGVENILDIMIPDGIKQNLNPAEIFYLLEATLFHDVGMKLMNETEEKEFNRLDEAGKEKFRENIRNEHHIRSSVYIKENASVLDLKNGEAEAISDIARAHREIDIENELTDPIHKDARIHLKFLGAILRIADECHVTEDRVSDLFLKTIKSFSYEFTKHFRKHRIITGITFNEKNDGKIRLSAIATLKEDEDILDNIKMDIEDRLDTVKDLFEENGLTLRSVCLEVNREEIIKKKTILNLLDGKRKTITVISSETNESSSKIEKKLADLKVNGIISENESGFCLLEDINSFIKLVFMFAGDENNWAFVESNYSQKMIEKNLLPHLQYRYNVIYIGNELNKRIELLKSSPTAIYLSIQGQELLNTPYLDQSLIQGGIVLDQMILTGISYDIFKYPVNNIEEIKSIVGYLLENSNIKFLELSNLYDQVRKNSIKENQELIDELTSENDDEKRKYSFNIKFQFSEYSDEPTFLSLLNAALKTRAPIVITGGRILDFILKEDNKPIKMEKISGIEITPGPIIPLTLKIEDSCMFKNLQFRYQKINGIERFTTELRNLPYKFEIDCKKKQVHFEISDNTDVKQLLNYDEFMRKLNQKRKLVLFEPKKNKVLIEFKVPHDKRVDNTSNEELKKLVKIQERTGHKIKLPLNIGVNERILIDQAIEIIDNGELKTDKCFNTILKVKKLKEILKTPEKKVILKHSEYSFLISGNKIELGPILLPLTNFKIDNISNIKSEIEKLKDNDNIEMKICPKNGRNTIIFENYKNGNIHDY